MIQLGLLFALYAAPQFSWLNTECRPEFLHPSALEQQVTLELGTEVDAHVLLRQDCHSPLVQRLTIIRQNGVLLTETFDLEKIAPSLRLRALALTIAEKILAPPPAANLRADDLAVARKSTQTSSVTHKFVPQTADKPLPSFAFTLRLDAEHYDQDSTPLFRVSGLVDHSIYRKYVLALAGLSLGFHRRDGDLGRLTVWAPQILLGLRLKTQLGATSSFLAGPELRGGVAHLSGQSNGDVIGLSRTRTLIDVAWLSELHLAVNEHWSTLLGLRLGSVVKGVAETSELQFGLRGVFVGVYGGLRYQL